MSLEITERDREGIAILDCKGRLAAGEATESFREKTRALVDGGQINLILNFLQVDHIDSSGLGELVALSTETNRVKGQIKLVELNKQNVELLVITKLTTVFELYDDEQDAVNSFFPDRKVQTFDLLTFVRDIDHD